MDILRLNFPILLTLALILIMAYDPLVLSAMGVVFIKKGRDNFICDKLPNLNATYPDVVSTSFLHYEELWPISCGSSSAAWSLLLDRLADPIIPEITLLVMGGSETAGVDCVREIPEGPAMTLKNCAWAGRFGATLKALFPLKLFNIVNVASGGTTITASLPLVPAWIAATKSSFGSLTLVISDFIVNDSFEGHTGDDQGIIAAYEKLILMVRRLSVDSHLLFFNSCCLDICSPTNALIKRIASFYDVPVISFHDLAVIAGDRAGHSIVSNYWRSTTPHPPWTVHDVMAKTLSRCLIRTCFSMCGLNFLDNVLVEGQLTFSVAEVLDNIAVCDIPVTQYLSFESPTTGVTNQQWPLIWEREDKPGWVSVNGDSKLSFILTFGAHPRLLITYLRSYTGLASVDFHFQDIPDRIVTLPGLYTPDDVQYEQHVSQSFLASFNVEMNSFQPQVGLSGVLGFNIAPHSTHILSFNVHSQNNFTKFKIISVTAC